MNIDFSKTLTESQNKAAQAFFDFLLSDEIYFGISGNPGTGKTHLTANMAHKIYGDYELACKISNIPTKQDSMYFTATTNKAAEALESALGLRVTTIYNHLALTLKHDFTKGIDKIEPRKDCVKQFSQILFIDECSMIDKELLSWVDKLLVNCKIVFIGDHAQMPPVNEKISPIYSRIKPEYMVTLTEPVRNAGQPALIDLCNQLRDTVETGIFKPIDEVPGVVDYLDKAQMEQEITRAFSKDNPSARILCYTNQRVKQYSDAIREIQGITEPIIPGETLIVAQAYKNGKISLTVEREVVVHFVDSKTEFYDTGNIPFKYITILSNGTYHIVPYCLDKELLKQEISLATKNKDWPNKYRLKNFFADLRPKHSCTVYKAQGSTYDEVFVDIGNIGTCRDPNQVARMLFVAISRARNRVFLFGELPKQYRGF